MLRIGGCLLITGATTLVGIQRARALQAQYEEMLYLYKIICQIQSEIRYARSYLSEIFIETGRKADAPYREWLVNLGKWMEQEERDNFDVMWRKSIGQYLCDSRIPKKEMERLQNFGTQLGIADIQMQVRFLDLYLEQLRIAMKETKEGMGTKMRLSHCLGVMSGILISVLLL